VIIDNYPHQIPACFNEKIRGSSSFSDRDLPNLRTLPISPTKNNRNLLQNNRLRVFIRLSPSPHLGARTADMFFRPSMTGSRSTLATSSSMVITSWINSRPRST